jgi:dTDP-glucose 4,6-dehydratase
LGYTVRAFTYYNSFNSWGWLDNCANDVKGNFEVVSGDIRDPYGVRKAVKGTDVVLHLAALIAIPYSYNSPDAYVETNIRGTLNMLQAARDYEVYGTAKFVPITEDHPLQGQSPYSATKIGADQIAQSFYSSFNLPVTTLRPFNTYGPRQSLRAVIPTIITQIASGVRNIKLGATSPTRDFSFVQDTVDGFISSIECDEAIGKVMNLGSNFEISIGDTVSEISKLMGAEITIESEDERKRPDNSEVERLWADNTLARNILNWSPRFEGLSGFQKGLQETIEWFEKPENLTQFKPRIYNK